MSAVVTMTYIFGVTRAGAATPSETTLVPYRDVAAVTTPIDSRQVRARRRDLLRHADVLQQAFDRGTVVPLQFGVVVDDVVADVLAPRYDELVGLLKRFDGLAEVTLRAYYREDDVLRSLVAGDRRLERLRTTAPPLQVGEAVARALLARRDGDADAIVRALQPHVLDVAVDDRRTELEVFRGAFLVRRDALAAVDAAADALARRHAATTTFAYAGPLPPHHFVQLERS